MKLVQDRSTIHLAWNFKKLHFKWGPYRLALSYSSHKQTDRWTSSYFLKRIIMYVCVLARSIVQGWHINVLIEPINSMVRRAKKMLRSNLFPLLLKKGVRIISTIFAITDFSSILFCLSFSCMALKPINISWIRIGSKHVSYCIISSFQRLLKYKS